MKREDVKNILKFLNYGLFFSGLFLQSNMKEKTFNDFCGAWNYLDDCDYYKYKYKTQRGGELLMGSFQRALHIMVVKVNPKTNSVDDDTDKNTKTQVWLESGSYVYDENVDGWISTQDIRLDTGGDTFEEAIINLANLVSKLTTK